MMLGGDTMHTVHTRVRTEADGAVVLRVPGGLPNVEVEVTVIVNPAPPMRLDPPAWRRFVGETAGGIPDPSFSRHP
jgi:hypothetical protein